MDTSRLSVNLKSFQPSNDGKTFLYNIKITYGIFEWVLSRRFSEFYTLSNQLFSEGYALLPTLPPKTLVRPNQPDVAQERCHQLHRYLLQLLIRPDLRLARPTIMFLEFEEHVSISIPEIKLKPTLSTNEQRFAVTDFSYLEQLMILIVSQADQTPLSKLGKAWSVIEPEQVGAYLLYTFTISGDIDPPSSNPNSRQTTPHYRTYNAPVTLEKLSGMACPQRMVVCQAVYHPTQKAHLLFGTEQGELCIFRLEDGMGRPVLKPEQRFEVHIKAPFVQLQQFGDVLGSIGADSALRILHAPIVRSHGALMSPETSPGDYEMISGGRIVRPLQKSEVLTCLLVHAETRKAFVGTSHRKVLVYDIQSHPPRLILSIDVTTGTAANSLLDCETARALPEGPSVSCMCISPDWRWLILCLHTQIALMRMTDLLSDGLPEVLIERIDVPYGITALCCTEMEGYQFLFVAMNRIISIYRLDDQKLLQSIEFYTWGRISKMEVLRIPTHISLMDFTPVHFQHHLTVGTAARGVQFIPLIGLDRWISWPEGDASLDSQVKTQSEIKMATESESEIDQDLDLLNAFDVAVF